MTEGIVIAVIGAVQAITLGLITAIMSRLGKVKTDAAAARHQLEPNSGGSAKDAITRIEAKLTADYHRLGGLERRLDDHIEQSATLIHLLTKGKNT
ncbi:hypothetical protein [Microbacterium resistens]